MSKWVASSCCCRLSCCVPSTDSHTDVNHYLGHFCSYLIRTLTVIGSQPGPMVHLLPCRTALSASKRVSNRTNETPRDIPVSLHVNWRTEMILPNLEKYDSTSARVKYLGRPDTYRFVFLISSELGRAYETLICLFWMHRPFISLTARAASSSWRNLSAN